MKPFLLSTFFLVAVHSIPAQTQLELRTTYQFKREENITRQIFTSSWGDLSTTRHFAEIEFLENHTYRYREGMIWNRPKKSSDTLVYEMHTGMWFANDSMVKLVHYSKLFNNTMTETLKGDLILSFDWLRHIGGLSRDMTFRKQLRCETKIESKVLKRSPVLEVPNTPCLLKWD